jgi:hypothetical protein
VWSGVQITPTPTHLFFQFSDFRFHLNFIHWLRIIGKPSTTPLSQRARDCAYVGADFRQALL